MTANLETLTILLRAPLEAVLYLVIAAIGMAIPITIGVLIHTYLRTFSYWENNIEWIFHHPIIN